MAIQPVEQGSAFAFRNVINNNFYELKVLSGASKPTQSTAAVVGQMYLDTSEGKMYFCSNVSGSVYTWKPFASDMSASNVSYNNSSSGMSSDNVQDAIDELFTSASNGKELIADAITGMGVSTSANDTYATMAENIEKIETGIDISDATLTSASELKKDIVAYSKTGQKIVGSLGQGTVNTPNISINSAGKITASTSYTSGIIGASTVSNTYQMITQGTKNWIPDANNEYYIEAGTYLTGRQTIKQIMLNVGCTISLEEMKIGSIKLKFEFHPDFFYVYRVPASSSQFGASYILIYDILGYSYSISIVPRSNTLNIEMFLGSSQFLNEDLNWSYSVDTSNHNFSYITLTNERIQGSTKAYAAEHVYIPRELWYY